MITPDEAEARARKHLQKPLFSKRWKMGMVN